MAAAAIAVAALAVVLVIALSGGDDDESASTQAATTGTTADGNGAKGEEEGGGESNGTKGTTRNPPAAGTEEQRTRQLSPTIRQRVAGAGLETVRVRNGKPVGGLLRLVYDKGNRVRLRILPDREGRFAISTLGLARRGGPPRGVTFDFIARQSGLFGVELRRGGGRTRVAVLVIH